MQFNIDYSAINPKLFFSRPKVGFKEQNKFCTGIKWSLPRAINQQDSPGLKTFPASNTFVADDDFGCIKKAWSCKTDEKGENLYAICDKGIILLLTEKSVLSNLTGDDLTVISTDNFISSQYKISKVGSNDEMWRGMAEASIKMESETGSVQKEVLFFPNSTSIFMLMDNFVFDIAHNNYLARASSSLKGVLPGYQTQVTGHFDPNHNEYWLQIPDQYSKAEDKCFVYAFDTRRFIGRFSYAFDKYVYHKGDTYGLRDGELYTLDKGFSINGNPIDAWIIQTSSVGINSEKEAISIEINTSLRGQMKPTEVVFMDEQLTELSRLNQSLFGPLYLKQYNGWWNQIPRKEFAVSANRYRVQYRLFLYKIRHTFEEDFVLVSSVIQFKQIK